MSTAVSRVSPYALYAIDKYTVKTKDKACRQADTLCLRQYTIVLSDSDYKRFLNSFTTSLETFPSTDNPLSF